MSVGVRPWDWNGAARRWYVHGLQPDESSTSQVPGPVYLRCVVDGSFESQIGKGNVGRRLGGGRRVHSRDDGTAGVVVLVPALASV